MRIIKQLDTGVVLFAGEDLTLDDSGAAGGYVSHTTLVEVDQVVGTQDIAMPPAEEGGEPIVMEIPITQRVQLEQVVSTPSWRHSETTSENAVLVEDVTLPAHFIGGAYTHDDAAGWAVHDQALIDGQLEPIRAAMWERIKAHRDMLQDSGGVQIAGKWFHTDRDSRIKYLGLRDLARDNAIPANTAWKTLDGTFVPLTVNLANSLFSSMVLFDMAIFKQAEIHRAQMNASPDPANYDFSGDWPQTFGG